MKRIIAIFVAVTIFSSCLVSCEDKGSKDSSYDEYLNEMNAAYVSDDYLDTQQKEIETMLEEYSEKIKQASDDDERETLKKECIEKIAGIDKKELAEAKLRAEAFFDSLKNKLLPYWVSVEYVKTRCEMYEPAKTAEEINAAVDKMESIVKDYSDSAVVKAHMGSKTAEVTFTCSLNEDGAPVVDCKADKQWADVKVPSNGYFGVSFLAHINSNILDDLSAFDRAQVKWSESRELIYKQFGIINSTSVSVLNQAYGIQIKNNTYYSLLDGTTKGAEIYYDEPAQAGFAYLDDSTVRANILTKEQYDVIQSDSERFTNSLGVSVERNNGFGYLADFVTIKVIVGPGSVDWEESEEYSPSFAVYRIML